MFARILEITPKLEKKEELINVVRQEILPILKKQPGFIELMPFVPEFPNEKVVAISLWAEKYEAEKYVKEVFPKVEQILKPYLAVPVTFKPYTLETTVCRHLAEVLTATV
jgi:Antibiotic biosynthesis monooxygenase